ncbi:hypothetical protein XA68_18217 [Ophiocordyceps unilateralis]|uniref:Uncharacterized protein n=1 Tax=Ophiocordyceps unilateralis TaxID=268505 RepID=A0A2A9PRG4_OPHUN|nr:hypothetical protein XA68_18217 [Ophiocordyceps unilateralis]
MKRVQILAALAVAFAAVADASISYIYTLKPNTNADLFVEQVEASGLAHFRRKSVDELSTTVSFDFDTQKAADDVTHMAVVEKVYPLVKKPKVDGFKSMGHRRSRRQLAAKGLGGRIQSRNVDDDDSLVRRSDSLNMPHQARRRDAFPGRMPLQSFSQDNDDLAGPQAVDGHKPAKRAVGGQRPAVHIFDDDGDDSLVRRSGSLNMPHQARRRDAFPGRMPLQSFSQDNDDLANPQALGGRKPSKRAVGGHRPAVHIFDDEDDKTWSRL